MPIVITLHDAFGLCLIAVLLVMLIVYGVCLGLATAYRHITRYFRNRSH